MTFTPKFQAAPTASSTALPPKAQDGVKHIGLYIHFPWCVRKCPYCDFNSHESGVAGADTDALYRAYLDALLSDLEFEYSMWQGQQPVIRSVFIGGGTPSLAPGWFYSVLLDKVRALFTVVDDLEITMEANPGALEYDRFERYLDAGINRLSLGVQSFSSAHLKALGRIHSVDQVYKAYDAARLAGFLRINIDIMFGLPDQSVEQGLADLSAALALEPEHLSWYQLTIEPNTVFYTQPPVLNVDVSHELWNEGRSLLSSRGFKQYEVSAYAKPGEICRQNELYWRFGDYAAIGAGAHGKITCGKEVWRYQKTRLPSHYQKRMHRIPVNARVGQVLPSDHPFVGQANPLEQSALHLEYGLNRFRLLAPVTRAEYETATQKSWQDLTPWLRHQAAKQLLSFDQDSFCLTELGCAFLDDLLADFD